MSARTWKSGLVTATVLAAVALSLSLPWRAQAGGKSREKECKVQDTTPLRITNINGAPSYFAKVTADGKYMCYINDGNVVMDLENPSTRVLIPGPYDPVPAPPVGPGNQVTHISAPGEGMNFYNFADVTNAMQTGRTVDMSDGGIQPVHTDATNENNDQSIGVLPGTHDKPVYRMLTGSLQVHDYDTRTTPWSDTRTNHEACGTSGRYQLPMLSKNGQELSVYDTQEGVTKIMALKDDGSCTEELNLGVATGKVEFSYDGGAIAFHVDSLSTENTGNMFSGVSTSVVKNVYVLQLDRSQGGVRAGALRRITNNQTAGNGSYYPSFTQNGKLVYVNGERDSGNNVKYSFRTVDPQLSPAVPSTVLTGQCTTCVAQHAASLALGALWSGVCSKLSDQLTATDAALWALSLDPQACLKLINDKWDGLSKDILRCQKILRSGVTQASLNGVTKQAIQAACPGGPAPRGPARVLTPAADPITVHLNQTGKQVFEQRCVSCHVGGAAVNFNWDHLSLDQVNNMLIAIDNGTMPRGETFTDRESMLRPLVDTLRSKQHELEDSQ